MDTLPRLAILVIAFGLPCLRVRAEDSEFRVGVRAEVKWNGWKSPTAEEVQEARARQNIYVIGQVQLLESLGRVGKPEKLVHPVDELALTGELRKNLARNGYREAVAHGPKPEIVLIVYYGRGWLPNPYRGASPFEELGQHVSTYTLDRTKADYEEKVQRARYEKLFIMVIAVPYEAPPRGQLPRTLWKTIMTSDDPDHRDLNAVTPAMFAAAGPYFGGRSEQAEAEVWKPLPEGHVHLGETKVLGDVPPASMK